MTNVFSLDPEKSRSIGCASTTFAQFNKRVWENKKLILSPTMSFYKACILCTQLYSNESWTLMRKTEEDTKHLRNLRTLLKFKWKGYSTNNEVVRTADIPSIHTLIRQRCLRWLRSPRTYCMENLDNRTFVLKMSSKHI